MTHEEMIALIRGGVPGSGGTWADFGAGTGNFTRALRALVGPAATIYAVDQDAAALRAHRDSIPLQADFTRPLGLPPLDGALMANALHWIPDQAAILRQIAGYLRPGGQLILVEYATSTPRGYIPFPVPYAPFESLARAAGFYQVEQVGFRASPSRGAGMYAAVALRPPQP